MSFLRLFIVFYLCLVYLNLNEAADTYETEYTCAGSRVKLECAENTQIIIMGTFSRYSPSQCIDLDSVNFMSKGSPSLDHCIGMSRNDEYLNRVCNGESVCDVQVQRKTHKNGSDGTTCDFESNMQKIIFKCVPKAPNMDSPLELADTLPKMLPFKSFDICELDGPETISGISEGFIYTPFYPKYYGNNRKCMISIRVPKEHTLNIYVLTKSLEEWSTWRQKANDYFIVDNEMEHYGYSDKPYLLYSGGEREKVRIKFSTDYVTLKQLKEPKGFLLYFEVNAPKTTTALSTSTTTPTPHFETVSDENRRLNVVSQKMKKEVELPEDNVFKIIAGLVGIVGVLVVIIFGLLFAYRKRRQNGEEDVVYDEKSISSQPTNFNEEYQNVSIVSTQSSKQLNNDHKSVSNILKKNNCKSEPSNVASSFNARLKTFYSNLNKTLHMSHQALEKKKDDEAKQFDDLKDEKLNLKNSKTSNNIYSVNEFNNQVKHEKDLAIDTLKMHKSSTRSLKSLNSNIYKKNNIEQNQQQRLENAYVSDPMNSDKLQIYEVNFENNLAYLKPKQNNQMVEEEEEEGVNIYQSIDDNSESKQETKTSTSSSNDEKKSYMEEESTSLNDSTVNDDPTRAILKKSAKDDVYSESCQIYSTPTNKKVVNKPTSEEIIDEDLPNKTINSSVVHLLNEETANDYETQA